MNAWRIQLFAAAVAIFCGTALAQPPQPSNEPGWAPSKPQAVAQLDGPRSEYYVKTDGNDAATGTSWETAWRTLQHAVQTAPDGSTINMAAGTYVETGQLVINRRLAIVGWGDEPTDVVIKPAQDTTLSGDNRGWFLVTAPVAADLALDFGLELFWVTLDGVGRNVAIGVLSTTSRILIHDCTIRNIAWGAGGPPNYYGRGVCAYAKQNNTIERCSFSGIGRIGVFTFGAGVHTQVTSCTYAGKGEGDWLDYAFETGGGAELDVYWSTVSGCTGVASSDGSTSAGILATTYYGAGTVLGAEWNFINECTTGVAIGYDSSDTTIAPAIRNNDLGENDELAIGNSNPDNIVNAALNWYGTADLDDILSLVDPGVDYSPWLASGTDTDVDPLDPTWTTGFQPDLSTLWVDDCPRYDPAYGAIQESVDSVSGSTIYLSPGTYEEQVEISSDDLSLIGSGSGDDPAVDSIIRSPVGPLPYRFETSTNVFNYPVIGVHDATGVTIQNLRVDGYGRGNSNYRFVGIGFWKAGGSVQDCYILNIQNTPFSGTQHGVCIYAYNANSGTYTVNVAGTTVTEYQKNGMALLGTGLTATVTGCTAIGKGAISTTAQNGIQISYGAAGTISDCVVSGHMYTGGSWASTGLLVDTAAGLTVSGGQFENNLPSVYLINTPAASFSNLTVLHDVATAGDGFYVYNSTSSLRNGDAGRPLPSPIDPSDSPDKGGRGDMTVTVTNSTFAGSDAADSWGIGAFGTGTKAVNLTLTHSTVKDWDYGIVAYYSGSYVAPVVITASLNSIVSNVSAGLYAMDPGRDVNAKNNWWGHGSGPYDGSGDDEADNPPCHDPATMTNEDGNGNAVSDYVDYCPWLGGAGTLVLEAADCQDDTHAGEAGHQVTVELWMRNLTQNVTGYTAYVQYDPAKLTYRGILSSYCTFLLPLYSIDQSNDGTLELAANDTFGSSGTHADSLLATLVFDVVDECATEQLEILAGSGGFPSELSYQGNPVTPTNLVNSPHIRLDDTAPVISSSAADQIVECDGAGNVVALAAWLDDHGGASATDNCGSLTWSYTPDPATLSDLCGATGAVTVTFRATDPCGDYAETTATFTVTDTTPPSIDPAAANLTVECDGAGNIAALDAWLGGNGGAAAMDVCGGVTWSNNFGGLSDLCCATGAATVTFRATDACGNYAETTATFTIVDTTPPTITGCPGSIMVDADAGSCTASVTWTEPTATDACCGAVPWTTRSHQPGSAFPTGTTTVTYTFVDDCLNTSTCSFTVTVNPVNIVNATVTLIGVDAASWPNPPGGSMTRCIKFRARNSGTGACAPAVSVPVTFTGNPATGTVTFAVACGDWNELCAKDEQHTKWSTVGLGVTETTYTAAPMSLAGGDTDNDGDIDIHDVTLFIYQYNTFSAPRWGSCPWSGIRDTDFSLNGLVSIEDYTFLTTGWHTNSSCACTSLADGGMNELPKALLAKQVSALITELDPEVGGSVDFNGDGVMDYKDVQLFEQANGLPNTLSKAMKGTVRKQAAMSAGGLVPLLAE